LLPGGNGLGWGAIVKYLWMVRLARISTQLVRRNVQANS
jgi:hypothetical protein